MIARGTCHVYFAFLLASRVDLEHAAATARLRSERPRFQRDRRAPAYLDFDPLPLQIETSCERIRIGAGDAFTEADCQVTIFDFGAFSVDFRVRFEGDLEALARLSSALYEHPELLASARARVAEVVAAIRPALERERSSEDYEAYAVFDVESFEPVVPTQDLVAKAELRQAIARVLRAEERPLSEAFVDDALRLRASYTPDDLIVIDWSSAVAVGGSTDEQLVLEFANVELLELRSLDKRLDRDLEEASRRLQRRRRWFFGGADLRQVAALQVDDAMLYESVNNALSLLGDQWLADVYGLIAERYDLEKWQASVSHKLAALESIYEKISDASGTRRSELLEIVVIALIALEVSWGHMFQGARDALRAWFSGTP